MPPLVSVVFVEARAMLWFVAVLVILLLLAWVLLLLLVHSFHRAPRRLIGQAKDDEVRG